MLTQHPQVVQIYLVNVSVDNPLCNFLQKAAVDLNTPLQIPQQHTKINEILHPVPFPPRTLCVFRLLMDFSLLV